VSNSSGERCAHACGTDLICPPRCRVGAITPDERAAVRLRSPVGGKYDSLSTVSRPYGILSRRTVSTDTPEARSGQGQGPVQAPAETESKGGGRLKNCCGAPNVPGMVETMAKQACEPSAVRSADRSCAAYWEAYWGGHRTRIEYLQLELAVLVLAELGLPHYVWVPGFQYLGYAQLRHGVINT